MAYELFDLLAIFDDFITDEISTMILNTHRFARRQSIEIGILVQLEVLRINVDGFSESDTVRTQRYRSISR